MSKSFTTELGCQHLVNFISTCLDDFANDEVKDKYVYPMACLLTHFGAKTKYVEGVFASLKDSFSDLDEIHFDGRCLQATFALGKARWDAATYRLEIMPVGRDVYRPVTTCGQLIVFDGPDGAGKDTIIAQWLKTHDSAKYNIRTYIDPGSTELGDELRRWVKGEVSFNVDMSKHTELFLFSAARSELLSQKVLPAIKDNKLVVLNRFILSTLVYQDCGGSPMARLVCEQLLTDLGLTDQITMVTLIADVGILQKRINKRKKVDRLEEQALTRLEWMAHKYKEVGTPYGAYEIDTGNLKPYQVVDKLDGYLTGI